MKFALIIALGVLAVGYVAVLVMGVRRTRRAPKEPSTDDRWLPTPLQTLIGFVTNFFDTLGIGNFAPTTAWFRYAKLVPDELIPGTMNVGHTLPVMLMASLGEGFGAGQPPVERRHRRRQIFGFVAQPNS